MENTITFDRQSLGALKRAYGKAVKENKKQFVFQGKDILTDYAKYLIQYLDGRFTPSTDRTTNFDREQERQFDQSQK